jgi:acetyltransferase-like isoleucine patch superfamily enzyme
MLKYSSMAPNVTTGGNVSIGEFSAISIGATIKHGLSIGDHSIIGAGALLMKNCGDNLIMYGVPAKEIRKREIGEKYL